MLLLLDLRGSSYTFNAKHVLVILLHGSLSQPLRRPYKPVSCILGDIILNSLLQRKLRTVIGAKMAKTAAPVEVFWEPSVSPLDDCDAFLRAYPGAYSAAGASVE